MRSDHGMLIVIADGEHARFLHLDLMRTLRTERVLDSAAAHHRASALGTDAPGAAFHSYSSTRHALAPRHDSQVLEKQKFAHTVAIELNMAAARNEFQELVLVAPAHILAAIRNDLHSPATGRIVGTLDKDLIRTPDSDLQPHLGEWVKPPRRAGRDAT